MTEPPDTADHIEPPHRSVLEQLLYGLSVPERVVRGAVGLTAGAVKEAAEFLVPRAFQDSKSYEVMIRNSLNFLLTNVSGVSTGQTTDAETQHAGQFVARKAVGNFIDLAGMATLHLSPLWMLAMVSDVAYGSKVYLNELATELKTRGLIHENSSVQNIDEMLSAVQQASGSAAGMLDQPPLSVAGLRQSLQETRVALQQIDPTQLIPEAEIHRYWNDLKATAQNEQASLWETSAAIAMQSVDTAVDLTHGTLVGVITAARLLDRSLIGHYRQALSALNEKGLYQTVSDSYRPYVSAVWQNFSPQKKSWTETLLHPDTLKTWASALWRGTPAAVEPPPTAADDRPQST